MKILISGANGLIGSLLCAELKNDGYEVVALTRNPTNETDVRWDITAGEIEAEKLTDIDAVIHLAGEGIAEKRWSDAQKKKIRSSRVDGTRLLCEALASLDSKPKALICASAIGFYGDRGDERLNEENDPGSGFLPEVCQEWEAACDPAREAGIRVVNVRIGVVLSPRGGALQKMLTPFKLGVGGIVGSGKQYWSWVSIDDVSGVIQFALKEQSLSGPLLCVAPQPVTNREFTRTLGSVLGRPTIFPMPAFAARLALGKMADDLLLASVRAEPDRLKNAGYQFRHPELKTALQDLLE